MALAWIVDAKAAAVALAGVDAVPVAVAIGLVQVQIVLSAWRWRLVAGTLGLRLGFGPAVREYYAASLVNLVLPGGVPGDALRAVRMRPPREGGAWRPVVRSIVLERVAGQLALIGVTAAGFALWPLASGGSLPIDAVWFAAAAFVLVGLVATVLWGLARFGPAPVRAALAGLGSDLWIALVARGAWRRQGVLNLAIVASYIATFALAAIALGHPLPWLGLVTVVPVVLLSMVLPVTVGGWGIREGVAAGLWPVLGLTPELGLATAVLYGLIILAGSLPGAAFLFSRRGGAEPAT